MGKGRMQNKFCNVDQDKYKESERDNEKKRKRGRKKERERRGAENCNPSFTSCHTKFLWNYFLPYPLFTASF